jgi:hypothetical protein
MKVPRCGGSWNGPAGHGTVVLAEKGKERVSKEKLENNTDQQPNESVVEIGKEKPLLV